MKTALIAIGGNALIKENEFGTVYEQFANTREAMKKMISILRRGYKFVLTHGNGPQVGNVLIRVEASEAKAYSIPMGVAVAQTQGEMGYMIMQLLKNSFNKAEIEKDVCCVLTQTVVDKDDPQLDNPTKPIGPFYHDNEQIEYLKERGMKLVEDAGRGWRRVVPSPTPISIIETDIIKKLLDENIIVVAGGGGGMPVYYDENGNIEGIDGVVDKDLVSAVIARKIGAEILIIMTGVEFVYLNYNTPEQKKITQLSLINARKYLAEDRFQEGSMRPKIQAAIQFLEQGGEHVIITDIDNIVDAVDGYTGTHIFKLAL